MDDQIEGDFNIDIDKILLHHEYELNNIIITEDDVSHQLKILNAKKDYGCDKISPMFLKINSKNLIKSLQNIFNFSLQSGIFVNEWKKAIVIPLHNLCIKGK